MKPQYVYHGTTNGEIKEFEPRKPNSVGDKDDQHKGVYATNDKEWAIAMGLLAGRSKGAAGTYTNDKGELQVITYKKDPEFKDHFFVYTLNGEKFENLPKGSSQYVCFEKITPLKVERYETKDYIHLVRNATKEEKKHSSKEGGTNYD